MRYVLAMPTIRQLEYFVAIVEQESFTRAAEHLQVSQPGLSHQFRALEREIGAALIERLPRGLRLTSAGRAALPHARAVLAHARWMSDMASRSGEDAAGTIELATLFSLSAGLMPTHLAPMRLRFPRLAVRLLEFRHADALQAAMEAGRADVAVGLVPRGWDGQVHPIGAEEFVVVGPPAGVLGQRASVALQDLADEPWVGFIPESGLGTMFALGMERAEVNPRVVLRTEQASSAIAYASCGIGLAIVPRNVALQHVDVEIASITPRLERRLAVYTRASPDPLTSIFVEACLRFSRTVNPSTLKPTPQPSTVLDGGHELDGVADF